MWSSLRHGLALVGAIVLLGSLLAGCAVRPGSSTMGAAYRLTRCGGASPAPTASAAGEAGPPPLYATTVGGNLYSLSPNSGATLWCDTFTVARTFTCPPNASCPAPPQAVVGKPLVVDSAIYVCVSGYAGVTYALNAADGSLRWMRQTDCMVAAMPFQDYATPTLAGDTLFSGGYALDPRDGAVRWRLPDGATPDLVANGALYGYTQQAVFAWDAQSGKQLWRYPLPDLIGSAPTVANGVVYCGDIGGDSPSAATPDQPDTFALNAHTGKLLWRAATGIASGSPLIAGGVVYIGGFGPAMFAVDAANGHIVWRDNTAYARPTTPVTRDGIVYFTADGVYAVDAATGRIRWRMALGADQSVSFTDVALAHGALYFGRTNGSGASTLYALNPSDGAILWQRDGLNQVGPPVALE